MKILLIVCTIIVFLIISPKEALAQQINLNQFITIVNPVRISVYTRDPKASLTAQYSEVKKRNLPATWLLTYDAMLNDGMYSVTKIMDQSQELGTFLEVTPRFAEDSGVTYHKTDSWHRANSVFLSGYTQEDRRKLIDTFFEKFKEIYGRLPVSVGAWWIDSYSLEYMKNRYNIQANLTVADQFSTDGYQVWGQYWSTPYYPSRSHGGIPATTLANKLEVVTIQWAPRDPLNGYGKGPASLFSTQDYLDIDYFQKLVRFYAEKHSNKFGQATIGLEGDFSADTYTGMFAKQLDIASDLRSQNVVNTVTMKDFASWYRNNFPKLSPVQIIETDDFLGKKINSIWYQSPNFRINLIYNYDTKETKVRDFRTYHDNFQDPYFVSPNRDLNLSINIPSQIDSASNPDEEWTMFSEELEHMDSDNEKIILSYKNDHQIKLTDQGLEIIGGMESPPKLIFNSPMINIIKSEGKVNIEPKVNWNFSQEGLIFRSLTLKGSYFLKQRKIIAVGMLGIVILAVVIFFLIKKKGSIFYKVVIIGILMLLPAGFSYKWYLSNSRLYFVNQSELDALNRIKLMDGKKVVVYNNVCLQCSWHTQYMPAIFANKRDYVRKITGKDIVYNSSVFNAESREEGRKNLAELDADYIYVVRFEDYVEETPFSPGDLNIEEIYANANAQIWRVKKN